MLTEENLNKLWRNLNQEERVVIQMRSLMTRKRIFEILCELEDQNPEFVEAILRKS